MLEVRDIKYGTPDYNKTLDLRNKVMRKPLGLDIYDEDFSFEKNALIVGAFQEEQLIGVGTMTFSGTVFRLEYLCVDNEIQSHGTGSEMLKKLEQKALARGGEKITLDARVSAQHFYEKHGYSTSGQVFTLSYAPVPHIIMEKYL
ncbi:MAG: GNAT family N-acetyltransferase [Oscillospiraceae bacterium]|nr:GNAT family N-acetyltransferase [Oscillospiraceae bacterium]